LELAQEYSRDLFIFVKKNGKQQKQVSGLSDLLRKGHPFPGQALYKGSKILFQNKWFMGIKRSRI
jgi:hypothetical protein